MAQTARSRPAVNTAAQALRRDAPGADAKSGAGSSPGAAPAASGLRFVPAAGVRTHVDSWGKGDPVLMIHGASSDMGVFAPSVIPGLRNRYHLTAYDRPGMGLTVRRPPGAHTLAVQAKVAASVIEAMDIQKPIVLAHSFGGAIALRLALDRPELIAGLVLIAPVAYEWPGGVAWHAHVSSTPLVGAVFNYGVAPLFAPAVVRSGIKGSFAPAAAPEDYIEAASVMRAVAPRAMAASARDLVACKAEIIAQQNRYSEIQHPVAILSGDGDTVVSTLIHSVKLHQVLPLCRLEVLQGVGHMPQESAPATVGLLLDWVRENRLPID